MQKFNRLLHCLLASNVAVEKADVILIPSHLWGFMGGGCCWWWWGFLPSLEILDLFFNDEVQKCHDDEAWCRFFYIHCSRHLVDPFNLEIYSLQSWKVLLYYFFDNFLPLHFLHALFVKFILVEAKSSG